MEEEGIKVNLIEFSDGPTIIATMDYGARQNQKETAALIAMQIYVDENAVYEQRGDAQWLSGKEVVKGVEDGTVAGYYELQKKAFLAAGTVDINPAITEYVMLDIMTKAGQY